MVGVYKSLTDFLPMFEEDQIGDWAIDHVNDGTPENLIQMPFVNYTKIVREVEDAIYDFEQNHPEYELNRYGKREPCVSVREIYAYHQRGSSLF